jgi:hypothetical protein
MIAFYISIDVKEENDLEIVIEAIKSIYVEKPVYILDYGGHYNIRYETDQYNEGIDGVLSQKFEGYSIVDDIAVGHSDIKIALTTTQSPLSTDNWGRRFNTDTITRTLYFIDNAKSSDLETPKSNLLVLFGTEDRHYNIYVTHVVHRTEQHEGFIVTKTPFKREEQPDLLSKKLFANSKEAFWEGYRDLERSIEEEYLEFVKESKKRRKKK